MPKIVVDMTRSSSTRTNTFLSYGDTRSGKTYWAASFPKPLFLSDRSEKGWTTIESMPSEAFYDPSFRPEVWTIGEAADMIASLKEVEEVLKKDPKRWRTLVIDSLTFYSDSYFSVLELAAFANANAGKRPEMRHAYSDLGSHLRYLMKRVNELPVNVVWTALAKQPDVEHGIPGVPMLTGQTADKAPARCDFLFYHRSYTRAAGEPPVFEVRTRRWGAYVAGGRDGGRLPDPLQPSYRAFETVIYPSMAAAVTTAPNGPPAAIAK